MLRIDQRSKTNSRSPFYQKRKTKCRAEDGGWMLKKEDKNWRMKNEEVSEWLNWKMWFFGVEIEWERFDGTRGWWWLRIDRSVEWRLVGSHAPIVIRGPGGETWPQLDNYSRSENSRRDIIVQNSDSLTFGTHGACIDGGAEALVTSPPAPALQRCTHYTHGYRASWPTWSQRPAIPSMREPNSALAP